MFHDHPGRCPKLTCCYVALSRCKDEFSLSLAWVEILLTQKEWPSIRQLARLGAGPQQALERGIRELNWRIPNMLIRLRSGIQPLV